MQDLNYCMKVTFGNYVLLRHH